VTGFQTRISQRIDGRWLITAAHVTPPRVRRRPLRVAHGGRSAAAGRVGGCAMTMSPIPGPVDPPARLLMGPGPISACPSVLRAMSAPLVGQYDPFMTATMAETQELYRGVWATANEATLLVDGQLPQHRTAHGTQGVDHRRRLRDRRGDRDRVRTGRGGCCDVVPARRGNRRSADRGSPPRRGGERAHIARRPTRSVILPELVAQTVDMLGGIDILVNNGSKQVYNPARRSSTPHPCRHTTRRRSSSTTHPRGPRSTRSRKPSPNSWHRRTSA
jgi:hypothetical protein